MIEARGAAARVGRCEEAHLVIGAGCIAAIAATQELIPDGRACACAHGARLALKPSCLVEAAVMELTPEELHAKHSKGGEEEAAREQNSGAGGQRCMLVPRELGVGWGVGFGLVRRAGRVPEEQQDVAQLGQRREERSDEDPHPAHT